MNTHQKMRSRRIAAFFVLFILLFSAFPQTVRAASSPASVSLTVGQTFTKPDSSSPDDSFTYTLTALGADNPMPAGSDGGEYTFTISGSGSTDIGPISYSQHGTYSYEIRQMVTAEETGYTYDRQVYTVTVYAQNTSGVISVNIILQKQGAGKVDAVWFENSYSPLASDPALLEELSIVKTVSGNPAADSTFAFSLKAADSASPMPPGSKDGEKTITITGGGEAELGTWSYTEAGTYYYTVYELNLAEIGYTYDTAVYTITDSVVDTNGRLVVTRAVTNIWGEPVGTLAFVNHYSGESAVSDGESSGESDAAAGADSGASGIVRGPQTGDDAMTMLYRITLAISGFAIAACVIYLLASAKRRKGK